MSNKSVDRCLVCNTAAIGVNFGVPTCMPCKAFFRRNASKINTPKFQCEDGGNCTITYKFRRLCNGCRLAKCFRVGMKTSSILSDEEREARNRLVAINRLKRGKAPKEQTAVWMQPPILYRMSSNPNQNLSSSDQVVLANVFHAYENTCILTRNTQFPAFPAIVHTSAHTLLNESSHMIKKCIEFLKLIPQFNNLIMGDKLRLIKNHFVYMATINQRLVYPLTSSNLLQSWTNVFPVEIVQRQLRRHQFIDQFMFDPVMLKIFLVIVILSSGNSRHIEHVDLDLICDDSLSIFAAQNIYVELLWRYMLVRTSDWKALIKFFNRLVMLVLHIQNLGMNVDNYLGGLRHEITRTEPIIQTIWPQEETMTNS